nr:hypothetical protein [Tanacetum cinerariifolium]
VDRIPLEGDEILRVHGERTQGVVKTLMNTNIAMPVAKPPYCLAPSEIIEDFVVYSDALNQGLGYVLMQRGKALLVRHEECHLYRPQDPSTFFDQKELTMRQRRWIEIFSDYECEICYHPGKVNVSYADYGRKPFEFDVGDRVLLKVTPWKGVVRFGKKWGTLAGIHGLFSGWYCGLASRKECWIGLHEMAMAAFESQYIDEDTYSASAKDIEVQSNFLDDQLTNSSPPRNCMPPYVLLRESRQPT